MSGLVSDVTFDFTLADSPASLGRPLTPPQDFPISQNYFFDSSFLEIPDHARHGRCSSQASSVYSTVSAVESAADSFCTRITTSPRASPPTRQHGPLLLPKIRPQDQQVSYTVAPGPRMQTMTPPPQRRISKKKRASHTRSQTNPEAISSMAMSHLAFSRPAQEQAIMCSPMPLPRDLDSRRSSTCSTVDATVVDACGFPPYHPMGFMPADYSMSHDLGYQFAPRASSPLSIASTPEPVASMSLLSFLTSPSPAASLVRTVSYPIRDPNTKHFWWDVRNIRQWSAFNMAAIMALPGASALLNTPVPAPLLPEPAVSARHPETEASLHSIYASYYIPKLNSALAISSNRPVQLSVPSRIPANMNEPLFVGNVAGDSSTAAAMFGGKPTARVVGIVRSFDRFNTAMRVEGNIKRVEYLRGLSAIHHTMREHSCRYGFILTEIELVIVRNGKEAIPNFGELDVTSIPLNAAAPDCNLSRVQPESLPLTACLALWGLCQIASDAASCGHASYKTEIGAPVEGTRRKALKRDSWIPQPQLAEKREAKRARGWTWPEDAVGRRELGKRGVKYAAM
ncbi:hypothetical protein ISF_09123 [Cordyceps fumosorosea ARSEF 2679]|uniref:Sialidase n=1 Tax=Cordyceps fumosorosea (strain ARSEF 2679) TaxID=1081104 RepID=A0A162M9T4_CORFA|nr:hypothetical protein ISF_09123 [Cordyceps fumosorosea ARSEF 2679]OAA53060.1 hypothetical protein ISF_09123 [Cordyceps fumosorosea ARSEF 2679]